jgi:acyl-CoA thioesterase II
MAQTSKGITWLKSATITWRSRYARRYAATGDVMASSDPTVNTAGGVAPFERETAAAILALDPSGPDTFVASSGPKNHQGTVYGGHLLGQALQAATATVEHKPVTSLHAYFLAAGKVGMPIEYRVQRLRDSRRFANRHVAARQGDRLIFTLMCEFHEPEHGLRHSFAKVPQVPGPEEVAPIQDFVREHAAELDESVVRNFAGALAIELRPIEPAAYLLRRALAPQRDFWFRMSSAASLSDPRAHQCLLAFASDYWLVGVSTIPHVVPTNGAHLHMSSLDHAIWFHAPLRCDEWLLHHTHSPFAGDGLSLSLGQIYDTRGQLVASTAQEALIRIPDNRSHP